MGKRKPVVTTESTLGEIVESAFADMEELKDELQNWVDGMPENLQSSQKADELNDAISNMDSLNKPDIDESISNRSVSYEPINTRRMSRADRRDDCVVRLQAVAVDVREYISELESFADELDTAVNEMEAVEFPGMR